MHKIINYKGIDWNVLNPGILMKDNRGYLIDQLDNRNLPDRYLNSKISKRHGISPLDYYIIVVLEGDLNKLPVCEYNGCQNTCKFNNLKSDNIFSRGCCESHTKSVSNRDNMIKATEFGRNGFQKFHKTGYFKSEEWRNNSRSRALDQIKNNRHPFSGENGSKLNKKRIMNGTHNFIREIGSRNSSILQKKRIIEGNHPFLIPENNIKADRTIFLNKGNESDMCYFYIAEIEGDLDNFKIGVTIDPEYRSHFHHMDRYSSIDIITSNTRKFIADLEYKVKLKFKEFSSKGTETFPNEMKTEVLDYINKLI